MSRKSILATAAAALGAFAAAAPAWAACERHIVNRSSRPWTFEAFPARGNSGNVGNVWFSLASCADKKKNGPCTVPPGARFEIKYTTTGGSAKGTMRITDHKGKTRGFDYSGTYRCPYIDHDGHTGAVAVNDPARGDWNAWGDQW